MTEMAILLGGIATFTVGAYLAAKLQDWLWSRRDK